MTTTLIIAFVAALSVMTLGWYVAWRKKRVDVVDVCWGLAFVGIAGTSFVASLHSTLAAYVVYGLVAVWAYRLSSHIARRFARSKVQDERYTNLMRNWPKRAHWLQVYGRIFFVQALLATVVSLPVIVVMESATFSWWWLAVGVIVWAFGFWFEATGDKQLARFLAEPKNRGKLMTSGLWSKTRHPNYFGEVTMWWGIWLVSIGMSWWWLALLGPLLITLLLRFVSGVPLAEKNSATRPGWEAYKAKTPALIPLRFWRH